MFREKVPKTRASVLLALVLTLICGIAIAGAGEVAGLDGPSVELAFLEASPRIELELQVVEVLDRPERVEPVSVEADWLRQHERDGSC